MAKGNKIINATLAMVAALLLWICVRSITSTVDFDSERTTREAAVRQRLLAIRAAESRFLSDHGRYCGSLDTLVAGGYLADSAAVIPYGGGKRFDLAVGRVVSMGGDTVPTVECGVRYADFLGDLGVGRVEAVEADAEASGKYPGLKFGDVEIPGMTAASWE